MCWSTILGNSGSCFENRNGREEGAATKDLSTGVPA
jgi:hypothetical protein